MIVIDASAALRWFIPAAPHGQVYPRPETDRLLVAPDLFVAEVRNTALVYLRKKELTHIQAGAMIATIDNLMGSYFPMSDLAESAWSLAVEHDHSAYDCFYLALALKLGTELITADARMIRKFSDTRLGARIIHGETWQP
jgi:predicted nucleic acid-binding protein